MGKQDLPIPRWLFAWGAAIVLVISFVGLAVLWPKPRLEEPRERRVFRVPVQLEVVSGLIGVAIFAIVVYAGLAGVQTSTANLTPTVVYVVFWVGIPSSACCSATCSGRSTHGWRSAAVRAGWSSASAPAPIRCPIPERLGRWPAAFGILAFAWVELAYTNKADPSTLSIMILAYAAVQIVGHERVRDRARGRATATPSASTSGCSRGFAAALGATASCASVRRSAALRSSIPCRGRCRCCAR